MDKLIWWRTTSLRAGDWVEVRPADEILASLTQGQLEGMPVMPQMLELAGRRFRVDGRAHKTCDTVNKTGGRRVRAAVHLENVRCDGAAYDGCAAACLIFWKDAWLKKVDGPASSVDERSPTTGAVDGVPVSVRQQLPAHSALIEFTRAPGSTDSDPTYNCQATRLPDATSPLAWWDMRQYIEDMTSGNVPLKQMASGAVYVLAYTLFRVARKLRRQQEFIWLYNVVQQRRHRPPFPQRRGRVPAGEPTPDHSLGLETGDLVRVRSFDEILETLDSSNKNRGLRFDAEEVPFCGTVQRVRSRPTTIINELTGKMISIGANTVILDDTVCLGHYSDRRMHCPRKILAFWREVWLEPLEGVEADS